MRGADAVLHAATLHKPHVGSHDRQAFVDTNVTGTLNLLEEAVAAGASRFVFTSTTSAFGRALTPPPGAPAAWITEDVAPVPRNIYGATKTAAEDLCELVHRDHGLPCLILRTSRFFPESDDRDDVRSAYEDANLKVNELLYRRVDLEDVVERAPSARSSARPSSASAATSSAPPRRSRATTSPSCAPTRPPSCAGASPSAEAIFAARGWRLLPSIERVYVNAKAREELGWSPRHDFRAALERIAAGEDYRSELAAAVGAKGYHAVPTGPYTHLERRARRRRRRGPSRGTSPRRRPAAARPARARRRGRTARARCSATRRRPRSSRAAPPRRARAPRQPRDPPRPRATRRRMIPNSSPPSRAVTSLVRSRSLSASPTFWITASPAA